MVNVVLFLHQIEGWTRSKLQYGSRLDFSFGMGVHKRQVPGARAVGVYEGGGEETAGAEEAPLRSRHPCRSAWSGGSHRVGTAGSLDRRGARERVREDFVSEVGERTR
jgi:hypothetical protein